MNTAKQGTDDQNASSADGIRATTGVDSSERTFEISPAIQRSQDAFRAALPQLLKTKTPAQEWVAFCGDELVTFGRTKTEAYQDCLRRGLKRGTFVVRSVEPESPVDAEIAFDS